MRMVIAIVFSFWVGSFTGRYIADVKADERPSMSDRRVVELICRTLVEAHLVRNCEVLR